MDSIVQFLIDWGYTGMFLAAFLSGSAIPFSSEVVLAALIHPSLGLNVTGCVISATIGNVLGSMTCYGIGRLGRMDWLEKYLHMNPDKIKKVQDWLNGRSAFIAFFAFLPALGELISVSLGFLRSNVWVVTFAMTLGKLTRYIVIILAAQGIFSLF